MGQVLELEESGQVATGEHGRNIRQGDNSHYIENFHEALKPEKGFSPLHQLPQPPADFTGRKELIEQLLSDFNSRKGATISGLTGMGGIGKTTLALEVAHKVAENYPDAQIYLDLKGTTTPLSILDIARHVILSFKPAIDFSALDKTNIFAAYQSVLHGKKALLIFDNARSAEQITPLRPPEACAILVTSRWVFSVPGLQTHRVGVMNEEDAKDFLLELCPRIGDKAAELAKACAYLPLALRIAGSFLQVNSDWLIDNYLTLLNDHKQRLTTLRESRKEAELTTELDLLATFELSYNQLSEENQKSWRMLGVFPVSFNASAAQAMWGLDESGTMKLLGLLRRYSMIDYDENIKRYLLHDLFVDYAIEQTEDNEEYETRIRHAAHYLKVMEATDLLRIKGSREFLLGLKKFDLEWEHFRVAQAWIADFGEGSFKATELLMLYPNASPHYLDLRLSPQQKIKWLNLALIAAKKLRSKQHLSWHLGNLGIAYMNIGNNQKAIEYYEQALPIAREIRDFQGEGNVFVNLGIASEHIGYHQNAINYHEEALRIFQKIKDRAGEGAVLGNLGLVYMALEKFDKAIEYHDKALKIDREIGELRAVAQDFGNLGSCYFSLKDYITATNYYRQSLDIAKELGDKQSEGMVYWGIAKCRQQEGKIEEARTLFQTAYKIFDELGNPNSATIQKMLDELKKD